MEYTYRTKTFYLFLRVALIFFTFMCGNKAIFSQVISCIQDVNVSLGDNCNSTLTPDDILTHGNPAGTYTLMLTTASGAVVSSNIVTEEYLWTTLTAKVTNSTGNMCWSSVHIEDKLGPAITCQDITIDCFDMNTYSATANDACTESTIELLNETISIVDCTVDPAHIKEVTQTYIATDDYGNTSSCVQSIMLSRFDFSAVVWPDSFLLENNTNLTCQDPLNPEGFPDISVTGVPHADGVALFPYEDIYCNIAVEYKDRLTIDFGCSRKVMRTWYIYEWACGKTIENNYVQILEISDTELPVITSCPPNQVLDADGSAGCEKTILLTLPQATDDCSGVIETDIRYAGGFANNVTAPPVVTLSGSTTVTYTVYDQCDNSASCTSLITIRDNASPTAKCDGTTGVALRTDGTAHAYTATFDGGSFDDCSFFKAVIKRNNTNCGCDRPYFDDMTYLGMHLGHHYYLSDSKTTGPWAGSIAHGLGGDLVSLNTAAEEEWVVDALLAIQDSVYIGLSDIGHPGDFTWPGHVPLTYTNWAPGQVDASGDPLVTGSFVIINEDGEWEIVSGGDNWRYIVEFDDACGFGDRVDFCCEDVGTPQIVTLRAIDQSGAFSECEASVTVQDKLPPTITCPKDFTIECGVTFDPNDAILYGVAIASDQCVANNVSYILESSIDPSCGVGTIAKIFTASDNSGSSSCTQTFHVTSLTGFDPDNVIWPEDITLTGGCSTSFLPGDLPAVNGFPQYTVSSCDNVSIGYEDQTFSFSGAGSDACAKVLRTWTISDHCNPEVPGVNPLTYQQTIKINNTVAPMINGCQDIVVNTTQCADVLVEFQVTGLDDCAPTTNVSGSLIFNLFNNTPQATINSVGNAISFSQLLPVGTHSALIGFSDQCGNTASCTKSITVNNTTNPTLKCKSSISVNIQAMDLDNDSSTPAVNMVIVSAAALAESATNACNSTLNTTFSPTDGNDNERIFDCSHVNTAQSLQIYVIDSNGLTATCTGTVEIQDNNAVCSMLITNQVSLQGCSDLAIQEVSCPAEGPLVDFDILAFSSNCTSAGIFSYNAEIDLNSDGSIDNLETGTSTTGYNYSGNIPAGTHTISVTISDQCSGTSTCNKRVNVICNTGTATEPTLVGCADENFEVDCDSGSPLINFQVELQNNTCNLSGDYSIIAEMDFDSDGSVDLREDVLAAYYNYYFPTYSGQHTLNVSFTDPCGLVYSCTKSVNVDCVSGVTNATVFGAVITEEEIGVQDVVMKMEGSGLGDEMTDGSGEYAFPQMPTGGQYRIVPSKKDDPMNGVSTLDLILMQRHILGLEKLPSPYKIIAADIDKSGSVNGRDLVELRKLILGIYNDYPQNDSWRMVDAGYQFTDPNNPFQGSIDEDYIIRSFSSDMDIDFVGVKIGDVNNSVEPDGALKISDRSHDVHTLRMEERKLGIGSREEIIFSIPEDISFTGLQTAIVFDASKVMVDDVVIMHDNITSANFNTNGIEEGLIRVSWVGDIEQGDNGSLFKVVVNVLQTSWTSDVVSIDHNAIHSEAYRGTETVPLDLEFIRDNEEAQEVRLYQNNPNPWKEDTEIKYYTPNALPIVISIYDINGKMVYQEQRQSEVGVNKLPLSKADFRSNGVYYYELVTQGQRLVQKMILLD